jgi:TonB family protein
MNELASTLGFILFLSSSTSILGQTSPPVISSQLATTKCNPPELAGDSTLAASGGGADKVWVDSTTHLFYLAGSSLYGKTSCGQYMSEAKARAGGARPNWWYVEYIRSTVERHWSTKEVDPKTPSGATVVVHFTVSRAGLISDLGVVESSKWPSLDASCIKAVRDTRFFDPLPSEYKDPTVKVAYSCTYKP